MQFKEGLKASAKEKYHGFAAAQICSAAQALKAKLVAQENGFADVPVNTFENAMVDKTDKQLAFVGDAFLTLNVAKKVFRIRKSPEQYQDARAIIT